MVATPAPHIPALDGLRGVAIVLVLAFNGFASFFDYQGSHPLVSLGVGLTHTGWTGVTLFFVLSGYLIGGILMDHRDAKNYFSTFFIRRSCRILPLYLVVISPIFLVPWSGLDARFPRLAEYSSSGAVPPLCYPLFLQNFALAWQGQWTLRWLDTTWSLAVEEQFYFLSAFLVRWVSFRSLGKVLLALILVTPLIRLAMVAWLPAPQSAIACYVLLPCRWDALALGMLVAWFQRRSGPGFAVRLRTLRPDWTALTAVAVCLVFLLCHQNPLGPMVSVVGHTLAALAGTLLLAAALQDRGVLQSFLANRGLRFFGLISYGLYLLHEPVFSLTTKTLLGTREIVSWTSAGVTALALLAVIALATASWFWFERRFVQLAHRVHYSL